jgi:hypothetical protein
VLVVRPRGRVLGFRGGTAWIKTKPGEKPSLTASFYRGNQLRCHCEAGDLSEGSGACRFHAPTLRHLGWYAEEEAVNVRHKLRRWATVEEYLAHVEVNIGARMFDVRLAPPVAELPPIEAYEDPR